MNAIAQSNSMEAVSQKGNAIDKPYEVIVVGAGFAGIGAAIKLRESGINFIVLEKAHEIGGVWRDNTYPDCACDVPSSFYSYSFAPNPNWNRMFAKQEEIKEYTENTAKRFGVVDDIKVNHELLSSVWDSNEQVWKLETTAGTYYSRFVIMACGPMHKPVTPNIEGIDTFTGETFHSARWNHDYDLTDKKVAVIGTGASAIQFVPAIQPKVKQLTVFQRTAPWVLPKMDGKVPSRLKSIFRQIPFTQSMFRGLLYGQFEFLNSGLKRPKMIKKLQGIATKNIDRAVKDPALRKQLIPDYDIGCKRILQSNNWYRALASTNVNVVDGVAEVRGNKVISRDGSSCEVDVIIYATGFEVANPPIAEVVYGSRGVTLAEQWKGSPEVYLGTMTKDCPNLFFMFGANLYTFSSAFVIIEAQLKYIMSALKKVKSKNIATISVNTDKCDIYNQNLQTSLQNTVWNKGGCSSYFIDKNGRNSTNWPWTTFYMRKRLKSFKLKDYVIEKHVVNQ